MTKNALHDVFTHIDTHRQDAVAELQTLLRQPSISAQNIGLEPCAELLATQMVRAAIRETQVLPTDGGSPVVVGYLHNPAAERTRLLYGHYDVQPPEPLSLWHSDPFGVLVRNGVILRATQGVPPVNLVFLFEGEEEVDSPHLEGLLRSTKTCSAATSLSV